ncbi:hypothetical protein L226DRAFT_534841 [Lentinus tigrinus ALCF2SS1-7]|uniref:uncharacterized protein n=1 Tax=Lentinus tigrinus ALCF2SS1-7 TaxID=1328758 RepID=UPI001165FBB7|nr:hypothetical protein L226DRAFT_534841 [Lentinus tigrinus ALCF2SS1-7]
MEEFTGRTGCGMSAHGVTFKFPTAIENEDRMVIEWGVIEDQCWTLLAVFDGHSGSVTANYAAQQLPRAIRSALRTPIDKQLRHCQPCYRPKSRDSMKT